MISAYYNEIDSKAAAWLKQLIKNGNITPGEVDERSITEVSPDDLNGFDRVHFFAGVGTWDYCLNESGWGDEPIWTASLPCQPFSSAGKGLGKADERHLLPHFLNLVRECGPATIFGEQVASSEVVGSELEASFIVAVQQGGFSKANKIAKRLVAQKGFTFSSRWIDDLYAEMEAEGYSVWHTVLGAHSVNSPHIRQRLYWAANSVNHSGERSLGRIDGEAQSCEISNRESIAIAGESCGTGEHVRGRANGNEQRPQGRARAERTDKFTVGQDGMVNGLGNAEGERFGEARQLGSRPEERFADAGADIEWIYCRDNKYRPVKPGIFPLVDGITRGMVHSSDPSEPINANATQEARAIRLKGYGNAIQAQTAIAFITAFKREDSRK